MARLRKKKFIAVFALIIILGSFVYLAWPAFKQSGPVGKSNTTPAASGQVAFFDKKQYSLTDPASIWVIVNKQRPLNPKDYMPADLVFPKVPLRVPGNESMHLRREAAQHLELMFAAAKADGVPLMLSSGFRSYSYQVALYGGYVRSVGQASADAVSARPGYSEHQTGLAADIEPLDEQCDVSVCFANLPAGKWLAANAYKYGFTMRYPADKVKVTGYDYEPWHYRYVGTSLSYDLNKQKIETLEEFFGLPAAPNY